MNVRYSTEELCSICYDSYEESSGHDAVRLNCQHAFGRKCIIQWALESNICPFCSLETIPAEFRARENVFRRLANRTVFAIEPEHRFDFAVGLLLALCMGCMLNVIYQVNPDAPFGNGVAVLLFDAVVAASCGHIFRDPDPAFRNCLLGAVIGFVFSALVISIAIICTE